MIRLLKIVSRAFLCLVVLSVILPGASKADSGFEELSQNVPGFRLITNKPPVPDTRFFDGDNNPLSLQDFGGKALLVNFWATWCTPCVKEMPALNELAITFADDDFEVVAIASGSQVGKTPNAFIAEHKLDAIDLYHDPHASLMKLFETETLPTTLLVNREGKILGGVVGATEWETEKARALILALIRN